MSTRATTRPSTTSEPTPGPNREAVDAMSELPSWVTAATWASCTHCQAVRRTSKYRPAGILTCGNCGQARNHVTEHPALWAERAAWLIKLFRTAGVELLVGELAPMTGRPGPAAVAVACFEFDEPNPVGPLDGIRVTLHEDLTPWGLPRALRDAWNHLARIESWRGPEWTTGHALEWNLRAFPGHVDAAHRAAMTYEKLGGSGA